MFNLCCICILFELQQFVSFSFLHLMCNADKAPILTPPTYSYMNTLSDGFVLKGALQVSNLLYLVEQGYDNSESSVRKACVFCLVAIHAVIGDDLKPHLSQLSSSKVT